MTAERLLDGHRAVIVGGGGGGIGRAISESFLDAGASVAVVDRDVERADAVVEELSHHGSTAISIGADMLVLDDIDRMIREAADGLGGIDVLVTVVGGHMVFGLPIAPLHEWSDEQIRRSIDLNLMYVLGLLRRVLPVMMENGGGSIVSIGSEAGGHHGSARTSVYGAAKDALSHLARSVAVEYGPAGIRMNVVAPGSTTTPATSGRSEAELAVLCETIPLRRMNEPADIADAVTFLASPSARNITGQTLTVDGGSSVQRVTPTPSKTGTVS